MIVDSFQSPKVNANSSTFKVDLYKDLTGRRQFCGSPKTLPDTFSCKPTESSNPPVLLQTMTQASENASSGRTSTKDMEVKKIEPDSIPGAVKHAI